MNSCGYVLKIMQISIFSKKSLTMEMCGIVVILNGKYYISIKRPL